MSGSKGGTNDEEHPRRRLLNLGVEALSDAELVEILLRNGGPGSAAKRLASELMREYGGLVGLGHVQPVYLRRKGISEAKTAAVVAAFELARRLAKERMPKRKLLDRPDRVARYLWLRYAEPDQEVMGALFVDVRTRLIGESEVFRGTLCRAAVEPRAIIKEALLCSASGIILFHTHPSGDPTPSADDIAFTRRVTDAGELLGIALVDHLVLGSNGRWVALSRGGGW